MSEESINQEAPAGMDPVEVELTELKADPSYMDPNHPMHKVTMAKVTSLYQKKYPETGEGVGDDEGVFLTPSQPALQAEAPPIAGVELPEAPEGFEWDDQAIRGFVPIAKEMGLSDEEITVELQAFTVTGYGDPAHFDEDSGIEYLNRHWGNSASSVVKLAQDFIRELPPATRSKLEAWLENTGFGNDPRVIEAFARRQTRKRGFAND